MPPTLTHEEAKLLADQIWRLGKMVAKREDRESPLAQILKVMVQAAIQGASVFGVQFRSSKTAMQGPNGLTWEWVNQKQGDSESSEAHNLAPAGSTPAPAPTSTENQGQPEGAGGSGVAPPSSDSLEDLVDSYEGPPQAWQPTEDEAPKPEVGR